MPASMSFCLCSQSQHVLSPLQSSVVQKALGCLTQALPNITSTYTKALLAYAFTLAQDTQHMKQLFQELDQKAIKAGKGPIQYQHMELSFSPPHSLGGDR